MAEVDARLSLGWDPLRATRVGEASNPGPAGTRKTARKRLQKEVFKLGPGFMKQIVDQVVQAIGQHMQIDLAGSQQAPWDNRQPKRRKKKHQKDSPEAHDQNNHAELQGWWEGQETDKSTSPADTRWQDTDAWNGWWSPAEWKEWKAHRQYSHSEWVDYTTQENWDYMQWPSLQEGAPTAIKPDKGTRFA